MAMVLTAHDDKSVDGDDKSVDGDDKSDGDRNAEQEDGQGSPSVICILTQFGSRRLRLYS